MVDRQNREDWKRERSLLALGQAVRGEEEADPSLVSLGDPHKPVMARGCRHAPSRRPHATRGRARTPAVTAETSQFQAAPVSQAEARLEADKAIRGGYPQAGTSEAYRSHAAAYEPRYAGGENWSSRDDVDNQEWKPLIDPMKVIGGIARSKMLIVTTTILGRRTRRCDRFVDAEEIRILHRNCRRSARPQAHRARAHPVGRCLRCHAGTHRKQGASADLRQRSEQGRRTTPNSIWSTIPNSTARARAGFRSAR